MGKLAIKSRAASTPAAQRTCDLSVGRPFCCILGSFGHALTKATNEVQQLHVLLVACLIAKPESLPRGTLDPDPKRKDAL